MRFVRRCWLVQIGYARVSTGTQTTNPQEDDLWAAGCEKIFREVASGAKAERPSLAAMLSEVRKGDVITVVRLDRLGRSLADLMDTVKKFHTAGVGFRSLKEAINTTTATGRLVFHIFGSLAEFEHDLIRDRVQAGLTAAGARGKHGGRPRQDHGHREQLAASMLADPSNTVADVCRASRCSRAHAYGLAERGRAKYQQPSAATTLVRAPKGAEATFTAKAAKRDSFLDPWQDVVTEPLAQFATSLFYGQSLFRRCRSSYEAHNKQTDVSTRDTPCKIRRRSGAAGGRRAHFYSALMGSVRRFAVTKRCDWATDGLIYALTCCHRTGLPEGRIELPTKGL